jgi:hypothetical protein
MRLGDASSRSYRNFYQRRRNKRKRETQKLCGRLDRLVARGERLKTGKTRAAIFAQADKVREKLREIEH